jgi:uncharacterized protein YwgA
MEKLIREAILISLIEKMNEYDSWCGETHIQKSTYFLQNLLGVPLGYNYILYKYGPYSFDLSDELTELRGYNFLELEPKPPYGATIKISNDLLQKKFKNEIKNYETKVEFAASTFGPKSVTELEKLATAHFIKTSSNLTNGDIAKEINRIKPHIDLQSAKNAVKALNDIISELDE